MTLADILAALTSYYAASDALGESDPHDTQRWHDAWQAMETAQDVLIHAAPAWFRDSVLDGSLYGTDLAGDQVGSPDGLPFRVSVSRLARLVQVAIAVPG